MFKRRNIREAAVQFLYFTDLESGPEALEMEQAFWEMTQEQSLRNLGKARCKAVLHVAQGREARLAKLSRHASELTPQLKADPSCKVLEEDLAKILQQESRMNTAIDLLKSTKPDDDGLGNLTEEITGIMQVNAGLIRLRHEFLESLADFPQWENTLEPVTAAIRHLNRLSERLCMIDDPESTLGDFAHIKKSAGEIKAFRRETHELVSGTLENKEMIDDALKKIITNYTPERVAPVDRAILRLAAYEILVCDDIPKPVSINEAVEIAKRFSTSESGRFINGVLDAI